MIPIQWRKQQPPAMKFKEMNFLHDVWLPWSASIVCICTYTLYVFFCKTRRSLWALSRDRKSSRGGYGKNETPEGWASRYVSFACVFECVCSCTAWECMHVLGLPQCCRGFPFTPPASISRLRCLEGTVCDLQHECDSHKTAIQDLQSAQDSLCQRMNRLETHSRGTSSCNWTLMVDSQQSLSPN